MLILMELQETTPGHLTAHIPPVILDNQAVILQMQIITTLALREVATQLPMVETIAALQLMLWPIIIGGTTPLMKKPP